MNRPALNRTLASMTMEDALLLRIEADAGNVVAVGNLFHAYGVDDCYAVAAEFCEARRASAERGPIRKEVT